MPSEATLNQLVTRVRTRGDVVGSSTFDDITELKPWIKGSLSQFHEMLVQRWNDFYARSCTLSFTAGQDSYSLPSDFRVLQECFLYSGRGSSRIRLKSFNSEDFGKYAVGSSCFGMRYRIMRSSISFMPSPPTSIFNAVSLLYTPQWKAPLLDNTPIDDVFPSGWEEWAVLDVLQKMNVKARILNMDDILKSKAMVEDRVLRGATFRDSDAPVMRNRYAMGNSFYTGANVSGPAYWATT